MKELAAKMPMPRRSTNVFNTASGIGRTKRSNQTQPCRDGGECSYGRSNFAERGADLGAECCDPDDANDGDQRDEQTVFGQKMKIIVMHVYRIELHLFGPELPTIK